MEHETWPVASGCLLSGGERILGRLAAGFSSENVRGYYFISLSLSPSPLYGCTRVKMTQSVVVYEPNAVCMYVLLLFGMPRSAAAGGGGGGD